jgi:putative DNA methylase
MKPETKRLIEVAFPLEEASLASVHEKNVRHGHISTLHIWPARRPLAASRAAILAALLPDPGRTDRRRELLRLIGGTENEKHRDGALFWGTEDLEPLQKLRAKVRAAYPDGAPKLLDPFAGGGAIPLEAMRMGCEVTASDLNPVAWFILRCTLELPQKFASARWDLPDFCRHWPDFLADFTGGKVKKRKRGAAASAKPDREQMALLFSEFEARQPADLAWHVRAWGRWVLERARADLDRHYPVVNGEQPVACLWARTARDPSNNASIPLLKTFWFNKKKGHRSALLPVPRPDGSGVTFKLLTEDDLSTAARRKKLIEHHPFLADWDVTADTLDAFLQAGTMNRSGVWSPCGGRPGLICLDMEQLRRQGESGLLSAQMTIAVVEAYKPGKNQTFKKYREITEADARAAEVSQETLNALFAEIPHGIPGEPLPSGGGSGAGRAFSIPKYGFKTWGSLFTPRQLLALGTFVKHTRAVRDAAKRAGFNQDYIEAVSCYLAVALDKLADRSSTIATWDVSRQNIRNTFGRFALPVTWDFVEGATVGDKTGGYWGGIEWAAKYIEHAILAADPDLPAAAIQRSAKLPFKEQLDLIVTDPPYYDAIPYSDLMDFFYVWLRRTLWDLGPKYNERFAEPLSPKWNHEEDDGELIDDESRFGGDKARSKKNYEDGMRDAFKACFDSLKPDGLLVIVFANKETDAWETLIRGIIRAGGEVTASWPIRTEMPNRTRGMGSAALSSSVWIVCRKRAATAAAGFDAQVLTAMRGILLDPRKELDDRNLLQFYFQSGIHGPDFIWAALGPALQAFSRHQLVRKTEGGLMSVTDFLQEVRHIVMQFSLGELPGFRETRSESQDGTGVSLDPVTQYYLLHRGFFGMEPAPAGACILYANACGKTDRELAVTHRIIKQVAKTGSDDEAKGNQFQLLPWKDRITSSHLGEGREGEPAPLIDRVHRLMQLLKESKGAELRETFERWGLKGEPALRPLLFALRHLAHQSGDKEEERILDVLTDQFFQGARLAEPHGTARQEDFTSDDFEQT